MADQAYWEDKWVNKFTEDGAVPGGFVAETEAYLRCRGFKTVLDLGAGKGRGSLWLAARGYKVTALDISPSALAHIRRQNPEIETVAATLPALTAAAGAMTGYWPTFPCIIGTMRKPGRSLPKFIKRLIPAAVFRLPANPFPISNMDREPRSDRIFLNTVMSAISSVWNI